MHIVKEMLQLTHAIYKSVISFKTIECSENVHSIVGKRLCAGGRSYELFGYPDSRNQFSGHRNFSSDCDLGRILFYETVLAVFSCGRACMPRTFCFCKAGNAIRIAGRSGMHVLVEHSGALRTGRACQKRLVSRKSKQTEIEQTFFNSYTF